MNPAIYVGAVGLALAILTALMGTLWRMITMGMSIGATTQKLADLDRRHGELAGDLRPRVVTAEQGIAARKEEHGRLEVKVDGLKAQLDRIEGAVTARPRRKP